MRNACAVLTSVIILLLLLPAASAAVLPSANGVEYDTSASAEIQIKPASGTSVTPVISGNTYYGVSPTKADWDMGDGTVYHGMKEVRHTYSEGNYRVTVTSSEDTWNTEVSISESDGNNIILLLMILGGIIVIICVCRGIFDKIGIISVSAGIILLVLGLLSYTEGWL